MYVIFTRDVLLGNGQVDEVPKALLKQVCTHYMHANELTGTSCVLSRALEQV